MHKQNHAHHENERHLLNDTRTKYPKRDGGILGKGHFRNDAVCRHQGEDDKRDHLLVALVGVVPGLFHTLYGHLYKELLFAAGVPPAAVRNYLFPVLPNDFIYPPNDIFFEATGVLELVTICFIAFLMYRLVKDWRLEKQSANPSSVIAGSARQ
jgi:hypothetical protein